MIKVLVKIHEHGLRFLPNPAKVMVVVVKMFKITSDGGRLLCSNYQIGVTAQYLRCQNEREKTKVMVTFLNKSKTANHR